MEKRTCRGCGATIIPGPRERNKRVWCSSACRARTLYPTRKATGVLYFPRCAIFIRLCSECGQPFTARGNRARACVGCQPHRKARLAREQYWLDPLFGAERVASTRAGWTDERREHEHARLREWKRQNGRSAATIAADLARRARKLAVPTERIIRDEIFDRDGWTCQLCGEPIDRDRTFPDRLSVSLDHIIPLSRGGDHTWVNVQCAHLGCNLTKRNRLPEERAAAGAFHRPDRGRIPSREENDGWIGSAAEGPEPARTT